MSRVASVLTVLGQEVLQQAQQTFLIHQRAGLQELAQLVHLECSSISSSQCLACSTVSLPGVSTAGFKIGARFHFDGELAREFK